MYCICHDFIAHYCKYSNFEYLLCYCFNIRIIDYFENCRFGDFYALNSKNHDRWKYFFPSISPKNQNQLLLI